MKLKESYQAWLTCGTLEAADRKEYFKKLLNPTGTSSLEETESGDEGDKSPISGGEVTVKKYRSTELLI